jgi:hypothetical protein
MAPQVIPAAMQNLLSERGKPFFQTVARLKPRVSRRLAEANLQTLAARLEREYPGCE